MCLALNKVTPIPHPEKGQGGSQKGRSSASTLSLSEPQLCHLFKGVVVVVYKVMVKTR